MEKPKFDLKSPCPNCGSNSFGTMKNPYAILPSLVKDESGRYNVIPNQGLGVTPVICNECGYVLLFRSPETASG